MAERVVQAETALPAPGAGKSSGLALHVETRAELQARIEQGFGGEYHRLLVSNPLSNSDQDPVTVSAHIGEIEVGRVRAIRGRLHRDGQQVPVLWAAGLNVPDEYRRTGAGLMLILRLQQLAPTLGVVGVSRQALALYKRLGWRDIPMPRYVLVRRSRSVVQKLVRRGWLARAVRPAVDGILKLPQWAVLARARVLQRDWHIEEIYAMDASLDDRLMRVDAPAASYRSAEWFDWLLSFRPGKGGASRNLYYVKDHRGEVLGYFLNSVRWHDRASGEGFEDLTLGSVKDWRTFDHQRLSNGELLLLAAGELLKVRSVDAVEICTSDRTAATTLPRLGFVRRGELHFMIRTSPRSPLSEERFHQARNWQIRPADGDHFYF